MALRTIRPAAASTHRQQLPPASPLCPQRLRPRLPRHPAAAAPLAKTAPRHVTAASMGRDERSVLVSLPVPEPVLQGMCSSLEALRRGGLPVVHLRDKRTKNGRLVPWDGAFHLTLNRHLTIRDHQTSDVLARLRPALAAELGSSPVHLVLGPGLVALPSYDGLSSFVAVCLDEGRSDMGRLAGAVRAVEGVALAFGGETYYRDPRWHVSVGWVQGVPVEQAQAVLGRMEGAAGLGVTGEVGVAHVEVHVGNKTYAAVALSAAMGLGSRGVLVHLPVSDRDLDGVAPSLEALRRGGLPVVHLRDKPAKNGGFMRWDGFHLSLNRPLPIRDHQTSALLARLRPIRLTLGPELVALPSYDGADTFLGAALDSGRSHTGRLAGAVRAVDREALGLGGQAFYEDPGWHVSVGWVRGVGVEKVRAVLGRVEGAAGLGVTGEVWVRRVVARVGNETHTVWTAG
ncbi:hypothetical protein HYH03_009307 [Edaphochlamys debaryana]|uniref:U6 snRNA phosphodiesterase 1 n=1 Tax=Edaphochlamys debaryana TaxID=47281 RepID=A0A835XZ24_9CHLO|nr:hypothetical protein HYH03_009307 [Edaphochlamys debaryana]|eukprot:KAG2492359.1 hypothetical protein HYH03_009307 [Edaphochlamys debaryana]